VQRHDAVRNGPMHAGARGTLHAPCLVLRLSKRMRHGQQSKRVQLPRRVLPTQLDAVVCRHLLQYVLDGVVRLVDAPGSEGWSGLHGGEVRQ
jgi:hypothetical protein